MNILTHFLENIKWYNGVMFFLTIVSMIFALYTYLKNLQIREPKYSVRTTNLVQENIKKIQGIEIKFEEKIVPTLSISKILFWNSGKKTIKSEDIPARTPLQISINEDCEILSAKLLKPEKELNEGQYKVEIDNTKKNVKLSFDFIRYNEGAIVELLHTGKTNSDIFIKGKLIDGEKIVNDSIYSNFIKSPKAKSIKQIKLEGWLALIPTTLFIVVGVLVTASLFVSSIPVGVIDILFALFMLLSGIWMLFLSMRILFKKYIPPDFISDFEEML
jgi:hypothetical protein